MGLIHLKIEGAESGDTFEAVAGYGTGEYIWFEDSSIGLCYEGSLGNQSVNVKDTGDNTVATCTAGTNRVVSSLEYSLNDVDYTGMPGDSGSAVEISDGMIIKAVFAAAS